MTRQELIEALEADIQHLEDELEIQRTRLSSLYNED